MSQVGKRQKVSENEYKEMKGETESIEDSFEKDKINNWMENEEEEEREEKELEKKCSICLNEIENEAFADQCFHSFCFLCIFQWSHIGSISKCPLCKQEFFSLIYEVKSETEYKRYFLHSSDDLQSESIQSNSINQRNMQQVKNRWGKSTNMGIPIHLSSSSNIPFSTLHSLRRAIYLRKLKAIPLASFKATKEQTKDNQSEYTKPVRLATPPFSLQEFKRRPTYWEEKLRPWLERELQALLLEENVDLIVQYILSILQKAEIYDQRCKEELKSFLNDYVEQFCHELINFANSPYSLEVYDKKVEYDYSQATPSFSEKKEAKEYQRLKRSLEAIDGRLVYLHQQKNEIEQKIKIAHEDLNKYIK